MPTTEDLRDTWRTLCSTGTPPSADLAAKVIPEWSVGIDKWIDRLVGAYLRDFCLRRSHFKLVIAPYGGGKTHFLLAFRARSLAEGFATCYLQCKAGVTLADWASLYSRIAASVRIPGREDYGMGAIVSAAFEEIQSRASKSPDPDAAISKIIESLAWKDGYASATFLQIIAIALRQKHDLSDAQLYRSALKWLQEGQTQVDARELSLLGLKRLPQAQLPSHGLEMFYSLVRFLTEFANVKGLTLLLDEMDTMFTARGRALERLMAAMRTTIDQSDDNFGSIPVFGLFAAVPAINEQMQKGYLALHQRFRVTIPFHKDCDDAPQISLENLGEERVLLLDIGKKLLGLGQAALGCKFDQKIQQSNLEQLVGVAEQRVADVDSRRLFVKTWCALLDEQARTRDQIYSAETLNRIFQGWYEDVKKSDESDKDDLG